MFAYPDLFPISLFRLQLDSVYLYDDYIFFRTPSLLIQENLNHVIYQFLEKGS